MKINIQTMVSEIPATAENRYRSTNVRSLTMVVVLMMIGKYICKTVWQGLWGSVMRGLDHNDKNSATGCLQ